jgi:hypothetical protein
MSQYTKQGAFAFFFICFSATALFIPLSAQAQIEVYGAKYSTTAEVKRPNEVVGQRVFSIDESSPNSASVDTAFGSGSGSTAFDGVTFEARAE